MSLQEYILPYNGSWSSVHPPPRHPSGFARLGRNAVNANGSKGYLEIDKGFVLDRLIAANIAAPGGSWVHTDHNGDDWEWMLSNDQLYTNDGATPSTIGGVASAATFLHSTYNMSFPAGFSGFFHGVNAEAKLIRLNSGGTDIEAVLHDMPSPTLAAPTVAGSGGTWSGTGTIYVRLAFVDDAGNVTVFSAPSDENQAVVLSATTDEITIAEPTDSSSRATKVRVAFTVVGGSDTPSAYTYWEDLAVGFTSKTYTTLLADTAVQAFTDINGTYRQATLPIDAVDICWLGNGRLFVASTKYSEVAWSERGNTNHWHTDQVITDGAETGLTAPVTGGAELNGSQWVFTRESSHVLYGDLTRDSDSQAIRVQQDPVDRDVGVVSHNSLVVYQGDLYGFTSIGPAMFTGKGWRALDRDSLLPFMERDFDPTYAVRIHGALDPDLLTVCWIVPRRVNGTRAFDGASSAGICDYMLRWDTQHGFWTCPRQVDLVHISQRVHPTTQGTRPGESGNTGKRWLMGVGIGGYMLRFGVGNSGGGATDAATSSDYDGLETSTETTTTCVFVLEGISADELNGQTVTLFYPSDDSNYPGVVAQKTITDTAVSDTLVTIDWVGALTVPTDAWTVRVAALRSPLDMNHNFREYLDVPPGAKVDFKQAELVLRDVAGHEAIA